MEAKRDMMKKVPVREQDPKVRATNFKRYVSAIIWKKQLRSLRDV